MYPPKATGFSVRDFLSTNNTVYILVWSQADALEQRIEQSPQYDTRGMLDYRPEFWGSIRAPRHGN